MRSVLFSGLVLGLVVLAGCGEGEKKSVASAKEAPKESDSKHAGWWCNEHGIPEAECSLCSAKVAKDCKAKGDWCDKHERAQSQCFICDPKLKETYAAKYRTKYGKEPPAMEDEPKK